MVKYIIRNGRGYRNLIRRLEKGTRFLKDKWFDPRYKKFQDHYEGMALAVLEYEIEKGIFDKRFEDWKINEKRKIQKINNI